MNVLIPGLSRRGLIIKTSGVTFVVVRFLALPALLFTTHCFATAPYQQDSGSSGIVSIEVEEPSDNIPRGDHRWAASFPAGFSGEGALEAVPNADVNNDSDFTSVSPRLDYRIQFIKSGPHYVWIRALGVSANDNSLHVGLDGIAYATSVNMGDFGPQLGWHNALMNGSLAMIDVPAAGEHTLNLWMREDGVVIDKVVLTTRSGFSPTGVGPAVSPRAGAAAATSLLPIDLRGEVPEQLAVNLYLDNIAVSDSVTLTLSAFDADFADEGELLINNHPPIALFGDSAATANDDQTVAISVTTPAGYWQKGSNTLVFRHTRTAGFAIDGLEVAFGDGGTVEEGSATTDGVAAGSNGESVLLQLTGSTPEEASMRLDVVKPASATTAVVMIGVFDADFRDEGELIINDHPPLALFGDAASSDNDGNSVEVRLSSPASYWRDGENTLIFTHKRTTGYIVDSVGVAFASDARGELTNTPPSLSGTPVSSAVVGEPYGFQPTAGDEDGNKLTFSISARPPWAIFNPDTGRLSGVPGQLDLGDHRNISISVSDGSAMVSLPAFSIAVSEGGLVASEDLVDSTGSGGGARAGSVTLAWNTPGTREDGSPLGIDDISGYTLYYGTSPGAYPSSVYLAGGANTSVTFDNLPAGGLFFAVLTAWDRGKLQSGQSNMVEIRVN